MRHMLDTNTVSFLIKGNPKVKAQFLSHQQTVCISSITAAELAYGLAKKPHATRLHTLVNAFLAHIPILDWDNTAVHHYAQLRADLERLGCVIGAMDMLIAAHALATPSCLVSNNQKEFGRVKGLITTDWCSYPQTNTL